MSSSCVKRLFNLPYERKLFIILFFSFFIIHGEFVFNKISFWDNITGSFGASFFNNEPLPHGKWLDYIICSFLTTVAGTESLPVINGIVVSLSLSLFALVVYSMFNIKDTMYKVAFGFVLLSIPAVAGNLGYGTWTLGQLICVVAAYCTCEAIHIIRSCKRYFLGSLLFAFALGYYQCHFALYISLCILYLIDYILFHEVSFKDFIKFLFSYFVNIAVGLGIYLLILHFFLHLEGIGLLSYANTDTYGIVTLQGYVNRIRFAYKLFFNPYLHMEANMFPFHWTTWYKLLLSLNLLIGVIAMLKVIKENKKEKFYQLLFLFFLFPGTLNFNGILYDWRNVHSLHVYQQAFLFLLPFILYRASFLIKTGNTFSLQRLGQRVRNIIIFMTVVFTVLFIRYDNYCYMLSEFRQAQAISYFTTLTTRIMSVNGYQKDLPVAFINEAMKNNNVDEIHSNYDYPATNPFNCPMINSYVESSRAFMKYWCGYAPTFVDAKLYKNNPIVKEMPCYPNDGSVKVIDNVVVVKFK